MGTNYKTAGVDFDSQFDPDVVGDGPAAPKYTVDGTPLKYADISYGTKGPDCGYSDSGGDLSLKWAAKGTASYALPIAGNTYTSSYIIPNGQNGWAEISVSITGGDTYNIVRNSSAGSPVTLATGPVPAGAVSVQFTWGSPTIDTTDSGGSPTNQAASPVALSTNPAASYSTNSFSGTSGTCGRFYPFALDFFDAASQNVSHTSVTLHAVIDGSA